MKTRIITASVGLCVLAAVMLLFNTPAFEIIVAIIALIAIHEIYNAFSFDKNKSHIFIAFIPYTFLVMLSHIPVLKILLVPGTFLFVLYLACCMLRYNQSLSVEKLGALMMFSGITLVTFYSLVFLKHQLSNCYEASYLIMMILCFAWGGDSAAYFAGYFFGKHRLAPVISPKKTVEGAIGGVLGSGILGVVCTLVAQGLTETFVPNAACPLLTLLSGNMICYVIIFVVGMASSVLGIIGDLFASVIKRQCGIKDYGTIFPGHGGILDRFDSVTFIAPVMAILVWYTTTYLT